MKTKLVWKNIKGKEVLYKIVLKKSAEKDLDKINEPHITKIINQIESLKDNPRNRKVIKLVSKENEYRLKIGSYRVLFYIDESNKLVKISRVLHRKDAY
jgi:mRNA interferase RelE/StbE